MIESRFIEKLLNGRKVEWRALGDVSDFQNGFAFKSSLFKDDGQTIVRITNINGKEVDLSDVKYFSLDDYSTILTSYEIKKGDILIAMSGATTGKIGLYNYEYTSYLNQRVGKFIPKKNILNNRYLYHYLLSKANEIYIIAGGGAQPNLSSNKLMTEIKIPIPPLSVQTEIARVLDAFTSLTAELTAELTSRQKQYQYFRDKLLNFDDISDKGGYETNSITKALLHNKEVVFKALGEVVKIKNGKDWKQLEKGSIPVYGSGGIMASVDAFSYDKPTVLIPRKGSITNIFYVETPFWNVDTIYYTEININELIPKYFYHYMKTIDLEKLDTGSGRPSLTQEILYKIKIPVPSLEEQQRIVAILDKFETLTNSIAEGLPKEIELRRKQYEYYREQLLTFPK
ncbi:restriction endonuclease subunit S [Glaesserella parasuis]|uniref:restriction endonuclease subunit S n=1 Tax=Glaesserella parasuis TaxID=738 RepID=UPI00272900D8|nr:restriction endonuclease subunit S [Glaesserella parasuis]